MMKHQSTNIAPAFTWVITCGVGIMLTVASSSSAQEGKGGSVELSVHYKGGVGHTIEITLTNKTDKIVECLEMNLPWRHWYSMPLILVKTDGSGEQLKPSISGLIDDPSAAIVKLAPNKSLKGSIDLTDRYPNIGDVLNGSGIDVFYVHQFSSLDGAKKRSGGWITIPRTVGK